MLVSPAERDSRILALGRVSSLPERFGCDLLFMVRGARVGIQRKEVKDLRASVLDGRLSKEIRQMSEAGLARALLVVEGKLNWTIDGRLLDSWGQQWTRDQWWSLLFSAADRGLWVVRTDSIAETAELLVTFEKWCRKDKHTSLDGRPGAKGIFGTNPTSKDWGVHFLMGLDGVGSELATRIWDHFGGVPFQWRDGVDADKLMEVEGVGKKKAQRIVRMLTKGEA